MITLIYLDYNGQDLKDNISIVLTDIGADIRDGYCRDIDNFTSTPCIAYMDSGGNHICHHMPCPCDCHYGNVQDRVYKRPGVK